METKPRYELRMDEVYGIYDNELNKYVDLSLTNVCDMLNANENVMNYLNSLLQRKL